MTLGTRYRPVLDRRGDGLITLTLVGFRDGIHAQRLNQVLGMRHRLDAGGVDRAHLVHQAENPVQPLGDRRGFVGLDGDAGEPGEAPDLVVG